MPTTRFPKGVTNAAARSCMREYLASDPTRTILFFEDFIGSGMFPLGTSGVGSLDNANWDFDVTEGGAGNAAIAVSDEVGGAIKITNDAADNDLVFVQSKVEAFLPVAGKKSWFKIRCKLTDANNDASTITQTEWIAGIYVRDTDPMSSTGGDGVTDGIFFLKEDGADAVKLYCQKDTTTGQTSATVLAAQTANTYNTFGFYFDGVRYLEAWVDDVKVTTIDLTTSPAAYLPNTECALGFGIKNGEAVAKSLTIDYILCAAER